MLQVMFTGARISPAQLLAQINAVTAADIQCVPLSMLFVLQVCNAFLQESGFGAGKVEGRLGSCGRRQLRAEL